MDPHEFNAYIKEPQKLDKDSLEGIASLAAEFPYCQSLRVLHLLNLRLTNEVMYTEQLKTTAAYIADRKRLRELVAALNNELENKEQGTGNKEVPTSDIKPQISDIPEDPPVSQAPSPRPQASSLDPIVPIIEQDEESRLRALKQIVEDRLKEISGDRVDEEEEAVEEAKSLSKEEIIDKFIEEEPSISRPKADFFDPVKVARNSAREQDGIVSETLARIHIQQGNIAKAIEIYRKLSLNFPEKSGYFAAQIKKISTEN